VKKLTVKEKREKSERKTTLFIAFAFLMVAIAFMYFGESGSTLNPFDGM
jgi:hypothetical protein